MPFLLILALSLAAPSALADPGNGRGGSKCAEGSEGRPGNANGHRCDQGEAATSEDEGSPDPSSEEDPSEDTSNEASESGGKKDRSEDAAAPEPSPSSSAPTTEGDLSLNASVDRSIAQVGDTLTYSITITNTGTGAISPTITDVMPAEVRFVDASGSTVPAVTADDLTWTVPSLAPGASTTLSWRGTVASAGDLDAINTVSAPGVVPVETHTYLAEVQGVVLNRSPGEPDWGTHEERRVVFTKEERDASVLADGSTTSPSGVLPFTGAPVVPLVAAAALLLASGLMLASDKRRRLAATTLLVVLVATACTSDGPPQLDRSEQADTRQDDEVLGTRVGRGEGNGSNQGSGTEGSTNEPPGSEGTNDDADDEGGSVAAPEEPTDTGNVELGTEPEQVITREVVLVEVPNDPPPVTHLAPTRGDNAIDLQWSAVSNSIVAATSRAIFKAASPIQFLTSLDDGGGSMAARVTMTNVTEDDRLGVNGRLVLVVSGDAGSIELSSPALQQTLEPGDEVAAEFELALPSGEYQIQCLYVTS
jgi:uncharacterized repeat protein (TIGR01451 family)